MILLTTEIRRRLDVLVEEGSWEQIENLGNIRLVRDGVPDLYRYPDYSKDKICLHLVRDLALPRDTSLMALGGSPDRLLKRMGFEEITKPEDGAIILYWTDTNHRPVPEGYNHMGIVLDGLAMHKIGRGPVYHSSIDMVPTYWGTEAHFFKKFKLIRKNFH